jgi:hypothetical protein
MCMDRSCNHCRSGATSLSFLGVNDGRLLASHDELPPSMTWTGLWRRLPTCQRSNLSMTG